MKRKTICILFIFGCLVSAQSQEYRGGIAVEFDILPKFEAQGEFELRKIFYPESYFNRTFQAGLTYDITPVLNLGISISYAAIDENDGLDEEDADDERSEKTRIAFDFQYQPRRWANDLRFTNRLRYQYTVLDDENERKQYIRDKITLDYKVSSKMNPYIALEPFFMINKNRIKAVRFYIGNELTLLGAEFDLFYISEMRFSFDNITTQYIVGASVKFNLTRLKPLIKPSEEFTLP